MKTGGMGRCGGGGGGGGAMWNKHEDLQVAFMYMTDSLTSVWGKGLSGRYTFDCLDFANLYREKINTDHLCQQKTHTDTHRHRHTHTVLNLKVTV